MEWQNAVLQAKKCVTQKTHTNGFIYTQDTCTYNNKLHRSSRANTLTVYLKLL